MILRLLTWTALFMLCFSPTFLHASDVVQKEFHKQETKLKKIQKKLSAQKKKVKRIKRTKRSVLRELEELDKKIAEEWEKLQKIKRKWTQKEMELVEAEKEYERQKAAFSQLRENLEERLRITREMGTIGSLNLLFSAETLPELMARETYLRMIISRDKELRKNFRQRLNVLSQKKEELEKEKRALKKIAEETELQALRLEKRKRERRGFLAGLKVQEKRYAKLLKEMEEAEHSLRILVQKLKKGIESGTILSDNQSFLAQKGKLMPPVKGKIYRLRGRGKKRVPGIVIAAPLGTEIKAIFDGTVVFNDSLPGYGNVLIIDHGNDCLSLVAQGNQFFKKVKDKVAEGETIGLVGAGPWVSEGIYFEIRHGDLLEDPLEWFDQRVLKRLKN